ncbi:MAG: hypothetical protein GX580_04045 [Candidatus Hydrogenedens sp.]|nr:hypothetical protein [Candidatus Hydrogenedentota bacterium]NLF56791.1 hypothetical protein [Candidatus Hydrogenedens sp.]
MATVRRFVLMSIMGLPGFSCFGVWASEKQAHDSTARFLLARKGVILPHKAEKWPSSAAEKRTFYAIIQCIELVIRHFCRFFLEEKFNKWLDMAFFLALQCPYRMWHSGSCYFGKFSALPG